MVQETEHTPAERQDSTATEGRSGGRVMVVDDEPSMRKLLEIMLAGEGYEVFTTDDGNEALKKIIEEKNWDIVIQDVRMPKMDGFLLLKSIQGLKDPPFVLVITAFSTWDDAVKAMRLGAYDYIKKPFDNEHIKAVVKQALNRRNLLTKLASQAAPRPVNLDNIVGNSPLMQEVIRLVQRAAPTDSTILIRGESGTGKELVARAIHYSSPRAQAPFIPVNCGAFTETLLESELFGHLRGSFTGAITDKKGLLEIADGGTFFLDEISEMSPAAQVKLLRVLENREIKPVGGVKTRSIDVRFITATNQDLEKLIREGRFREDLYYRLNVIPIYLPPLRERVEDIPLLAGHFLAIHSRRTRKKVEGIDADAMELLMRYDWPGNVRELENVIERAVALTESDRITRRDLVGPVLQTEPPPLDSDGIDLDKHLEEVERLYVLRALRTTGWNLTRAAELLKIPLRSMRYRIKKLGIQRPEGS